jgi:hypothetical protein
MSMYVEAGAATDALAITPSDSTIVNVDAIYVGTTGNVAVTTLKGTVITFTSVPAGAVLPIKSTKIMSTNTTASNLIGLRY